MFNTVKKKLSYKVKELYNLGLDRHEKEIVNTVLSSKNFGEKFSNKVPEKIKSLAFIIPEIDKFSGGITSILRLGTYLSKFGFDISYIDFNNNDLEKLKKNARSNLQNYQGTVLKIVDTKESDYDAVVATNWLSVYYLNNFNAYKLYFVQDFEPYFFKLNERYLLAKLSYELGAHIVSLGRWNLDQITKNCLIDSRIDYIDFPYEPSEYAETIVRKYSEYGKKSKIKIAAYMKEDGKRIPTIIQNILKNSKKELEKYGIELEVVFFGLNPHYAVSVGQNLGKLNKDELRKLYGSCDFGMVASMTNISLVPYEMLAAGLPLIEFEEGSYTSFLPRESAILVDFNYKTFVNKIIQCLKHTDLIEQKMHIAKEVIKTLSWEKTAREFVDILDSLMKGERT